MRSAPIDFSWQSGLSVNSLMRFFVLLIILFASLGIVAQSRRVAPNNPLKQGSTVVNTAADQTVKQLFDEANGYRNAKFEEFEQKKIPVSDTLIERTQREQKQLAAKYAALAGGRPDLKGEDLYYLGLLHWIAENLEGTSENLNKFLLEGSPSPERAQTSRSIIVVIAAKQKTLEEAERMLALYLKTGPVKLSERTRMESELAKAYIAEKNFAKGAAHASEAFRAAKTIASEPAMRSRIIDELLDAGMLIFEANRAARNIKDAEGSLEGLRVTAASLGSPTMYFYALDHQITYQIETGRKPAALVNYSTALGRINIELPAKAHQAEVIQKLKRREKHYKLLGETAPELGSIDQWFPGEKKTLADLRGKVILLDFWATWCLPCLEAFPAILELRQDFGADGFEILGVTRYYGTAEGFPVDHASEIEFLKRFRRKFSLPYDFVVAGDQRDHQTYGAAAIPTAVLIDRKGVIRYLESGTSPTRLVELREMIAKLVAEK